MAEQTELEPIEIDSAKFAESLGSILCGLGAQKYIDVFEKQNIDKYGLSELSDEDLTRLGIIEPEIRAEIIKHAKLIPRSDENAICTASLGPMEIVEVFEECALLLHRIKLSMNASNLVMKKTKKVPDCLLYQDKYASNVAIFTLNEIVTILNSMDKAVKTELKMNTNKNRTIKKKIVVGTIGSAVIAMLAVLFTRSIKQLD